MPGQITTRVLQTAGSSTFGPALRSAATCFAAGVLLCLCQCVTMVPMTTAAEPSAVEAATLAVFATTCIDCHTAADASGGVNVEAMLEANALSSDAALLERLLDVIESRGMPPDDVDPLNDTTRDAVLAELHSRLETATADATPPPVPVSRLNRFQYNNTVRDLFQLDRNIFPLPEKLLTRHDTALAQTLSAGADAQLPDVVQVSCDAVAAAPGLEGVRPFPKDLRASHGYDNQSDKLTLSPLLLDSFLHLSVSILESPDFTADSVGIWQAFFAAPPENTSPEDAIRSRLATFLPLAFRRSVSDDVLSRYTAYTLAKLESEQDFTAAMKKVAAAVLSSPLFLYRTPPATPADEPFALAERLAYSLWGSCPDRELIDLAADGSLTEPAILAQQVERMLADPRIERFLDAFPAQWMQLENILAATPDPSLSRIYSLDPKRPAGTQMVLEPLLLFEAVLLENRPLAELIRPTFSYRSDFLDAWYTTPLTPPPVDADAVDAQNRRNAEQRAEFMATIADLQQQRQVLLAPVRARVLARQPAENTVVDLAPYAAWDFQGDLSEAIHGLHLEPHGELRVIDSGVDLNGGYLLSGPLPIDLGAKSLEVVCTLENLDQPGGGLMGIQGPDGLFDTIVIGERKPRHWISGSNVFARTEDFPSSFEESTTSEPLHLLMTYAADGTTTLYRNGELYGGSYQKGAVRFPREESRVLLGLRHLPPGGNKSLRCQIHAARLYDRCLTAEEVATAARGQAGIVTQAAILAAMTDEEHARERSLNEQLSQQQAALAAVPADIDFGQARAAAQEQFDNHIRGLLQEQTFRRVSLEDPRYGGILTNAAMLTMTSGPKRTHPVARGVWVIEVLFNDPPPPPPNDVPPLDEDAGDASLTIRERFAAHRENPSCAGCHSRLDPLGFALENYDITGRWRDTYTNGRDVDAAGVLRQTHPFDEAIGFKAALLEEQRPIARGLTEHLLRYALGQELTPADRIAVEAIVAATSEHGYRLKDLLRSVLLSPRFRDFRY